VDSVRELGSPLLAATGTTVAAFLPLWMAHGQAAEFLRAIPQVVTLTLFLSLLAAMIVTPTLAALAFRKSRGNTADYGGRFNLGRAIGAFSSKHAVLILLMSLSLLLVVGGYGKHVRKNFFPGADRNVVMVDLFLPEGADIHAIDGIVGKVERHLKNEVPSVSRVASFIGRGAPRFYANIVPAPRNPHRAQMILFTTSQSQNHSVVGEIRSYLGEEIPQVNSVVQELVLGTPVDAPVEIRLYGNSLKDLRFGAERVMEAMKRIPGMVDLRHTLGNGNPSLEFEVSSGAAFRSFRKVGMVLATIPLASLGVIPGLLLSGEPFGLMSLLGVIALAGIVVNNAIVLLDVVELRRKKGLSVHEALTKAVEERIRPILLTSGTTAAGLFPLAFSSSNLWPPMAWAMISGLCASTALTLFVIPAMYRVLYPEKSVFARLLGLIRVLVGTKAVRNDQI